MPTSTTQPERQRCRHIHADGRRCGSPCLRGEAFCYFHHTSRKPIARPEARRSRRSAFDLPLPEDRTAIQLSIGEILRRIALNDVDPRRAGLLLYGLQIASTNLAQARNQAGAAPIESPVEELTVDPALGSLAPPAPFVPTADGSKPSLIEILLERLATPQPLESISNPGGPDEPQPSIANLQDAVTAAGIVLPAVQAAAVNPRTAPTIARTPTRPSCPPSASASPLSFSSPPPRSPSRSSSAAQAARPPRSSTTPAPGPHPS